MGRKKIDWESLEIVIEPVGDPNPKNPYAEMDRAQRDQALRELARKILWRKVNGVSTSN